MRSGEKDRGSEERCVVEISNALVDGCVNKICPNAGKCLSDGVLYSCLSLNASATACAIYGNITVVTSGKLLPSFHRKAKLITKF